MYQSVMNNQKNKSQIYYNFAFMKIVHHHIYKNNQYQIILFNMFEQIYHYFMFFINLIIFLIFMIKIEIAY